MGPAVETLLTFALFAALGIGAAGWLAWRAGLPERFRKWIRAWEERDIARFEEREQLAEARRRAEQEFAGVHEETIEPREQPGNGRAKEKQDG